MKVPTLFQAYRYELIAFLTGAAVMVLEIIGARLIAPEFGTSTYVWTAMIGVILGSLAVGFWIGGKMADRHGNPGSLAVILFIAALLVLLMGLLQRRVLSDIAGLDVDLRLSVLVAALLLFSLPSVLIGMVSPHLAKIRITSLDTTGTSVGKLEAAGALGSITGTFLCGYFLLGLFGSRSIIIGVVALLLLSSFVADPFFWRKARLVTLAVALTLIFTLNANPSTVLADVDSSYARYRVVQGDYKDQRVRMLITDSGSIQSAVAEDDPRRLVLSYAQKFQQAAVAYGAPSRVLVIGGGAYTFPQSVVSTMPDTRVDVAEIDPKLVDLSKEFFYYKDSSRLALHHVDGRTYLNSNTTKYDLIYMDAFSSLSPPFQLTTREAVRQIADGMSPDGAAVVNLIGRYAGGRGDYLRALRATYASVFDRVAVYQMNPALPLDNTRQNFLLVATDSRDTADKLAGGMALDPLRLADGGLVLTDDYAPIEKLTY